MRTIAGFVAGLAVAGMLGYSVTRPDNEPVAITRLPAATTTTTIAQPVVVPKSAPTTTTSSTTTTLAPVETVPPVVVVTPVCDIHAPFDHPVNEHCWMTEDEFVDARLAEVFEVITNP